jgi:hypothetical protein
MKWIYPDRSNIMLEGFCEVNIKTGCVARRYNRRHMSEAYRPLGKLAQERWKRLNEPHRWEYQILSDEELAANRARLLGIGTQEQPVVNITAGGLLMLAFLELLIGLSNNAGSGIEGQE